MRGLYQSLFLRMAVLLISLAGWQSALSAVTITEVEAGNVTPFSFMLTWQVSAGSEPGLQLFNDSEGTDAVSGPVVEFYPLHTGDPTVSSDYAGRIERRSLEASMRGRGRVLLRIAGLAPGQTYYARPVALDASGADITSNGPLPLVPVTTALKNDFVVESRQLVLGFSGYSPEQSHGAVARLSVDGLPYPLLAVVGDGGSSGEAFFNLDNLLNAAGITNLNPSSPLDLEISLLGSDVVPGTMDYSISYGGGFLTADAAITPYDPVAPVVDSFALDPIGAQQIGTSFTVTIRALDGRGKPLTSFTGTVEVAASLNLSEGSGTSPGFTDGVLSGYPITVSEAGQAQLTVTETGGSASGTSNVFDVASIVWTLTTDTVPRIGGSVTGAGTYADGSSANITAVPAERYLFEGWNGPGIADPNAASTSVLMDGDKTVTALFSEDPLIQDYEEWSRKVFGADPPNPELTLPGADYDFDSLSNLMEYSSGSNAMVADSTEGRPTLHIESGVAVFSYTRRNSGEDLSYVVQVSTLDGPWETYTAAPENVTVSDLGDGLERVTITLADQAGNSSFIRLVVTLQQ